MFAEVEEGVFEFVEEIDRDGWRLFAGGQNTRRAVRLQ